MKSHQLSILSACCAVFIMACQKVPLQSPPVTETNSQQLSDAQAADMDLSGNAMVHIDPDNFVTGIDNPYFPQVPGTTTYFKNVIKDGGISVENTQIDVTHDLKLILGVECEVVHDFVKENGILTEDTYDWFAQDKKGNVWYFGEDTKALVHGQWVTEGSWEAGVNGAQPGIVMLAHPEDHIGETYRQEYLKDSAEDQATVISVNSSIAIQMGTFTNCVVTEEFTRLEPGVKEYKSYAPGIGNLSTILNKGGNEHEELTKIVKN
jgi:hypothetical protein